MSVFWILSGLGDLWWQESSKISIFRCWRCFFDAICWELPRPRWFQEYHGSNIWNVNFLVFCLHCASSFIYLLCWLIYDQIFVKHWLLFCHSYFVRHSQFTFWILSPKVKVLQHRPKSLTQTVPLWGKNSFLWIVLYKLIRLTMISDAGF